MIPRKLIFLILIGTSGISAHAAPVIEIEGDIPDNLRENIRNHLSLSTEECAAPAWRLQALLQRADREIREAGEALGYYRLRADKGFTPGPDCWELHLEINPGPAVTVRMVEIEIAGDGRNDPAFDALPDGLVIKPGERLDHGKYEDIKKHLATLATTRGYFLAEFTRTAMRVDIAENSAAIEISYDTGPRYRFGEVSINQSILDPGLVSRYVTFAPGESYDSSKLIELQQALSAHYFSRVHVRPLPEQAANGMVPIQIDATPLKQHSFSLGVGVATDTGPRLKFDYANRYVNPAGHRFNTGVSLSPVRSELLTGYTIPLREPRHESLKFFAGHVEEETDPSSSAISSLGVHYALLNDLEWLQTWSLNFQNESFTVSDERDRTALLIPGLSFARVRSSDSVYPLNGWRLNAAIQGASADILSDISFLQLQGDAKYIHPLGSGRLLWRIQGGVTDVSDFDALPASLRFFAGGDTSVRGYAYRSLGPLDAEGDVIGGRRLLVAGLEYDRRILRQWTAALFYDAGNAFNDRNNYELKRGAGIGLRWLSPIGPLRLDFAKALDDTEEWRVHINMGPDL